MLGPLGYFIKIKFRLKKLFTERNINILKELTRAKLKASDFNSFLGIVWSLLGTSIMLLAMYLIFKGRFDSGIKNYALYLLIGIVFLNYFISATTYLLRSFRNSRDLVLNSTFLREDILLSDL